MNEDRLKKLVLSKILSEIETTGISITNQVKKETGKENKSYYKEVGKKMEDYDKNLKKSGKDTISPPKYNYDGDKEKEYHNDMEILNGQEMIQYDRDPSKRFAERAKESIEGSSRMGNGPGANAEATWGASSDTFGKDLVERIKASKNKRDNAGIKSTSFGDDIELDPSIELQNKKVAVENISNKMNKSNVNEISIATKFNAANKSNDEKRFAQNKVFRDSIKQVLQKIFMKTDEFSDGYISDVFTDADGDLKFTINSKNGGFLVAYYKMGDDLMIKSPNHMPMIISRATAVGFINMLNELNPKTIFNHPSKLNVDNLRVSGLHLENEKKGNIMKRLRFKTPFGGSQNAVKLIPEHFKVDNKVFEMTDGKESYKVRWEGNLNEGKAVLLQATDKSLVKEDIDKMKHLMNYKSEDTLGSLKGKARINEDTSFRAMLNKTKALMTEGDEELSESENINGQTAPETIPGQEGPGYANAEGPMVMSTEEANGPVGSGGSSSSSSNKTSESKNSKAPETEEEETEEEVDEGVKDRFDEIFEGYAPITIGQIKG